MNIIETILRILIPRKVLTSIKFFQIFNFKYGHSNVSNGLIQGGNGEPLPWITYPAIEFLDTLDFSDCHIFEYGSGASTLFWANRAMTVTSVEKNPKWFELVQGQTPKNASIFLKPKDLEYAEFIKSQNKKFDVVVVDGAVRYPCIQTAIPYLTDRGILILDNSDWYPESCRFLRSQGFVELDFSGFPPLNAFTSTTSIFFKNPFLFTRKKKETRPMGGKLIHAIDDCPLERMQ